MEEREKLFLDLTMDRAAEWVPPQFKAFVDTDNVAKFLLRIQIGNKVRELPVWLSMEYLQMKPSDLFLKVLEQMQKPNLWQPQVKATNDEHKAIAELLSQNGGWFNPFVLWSQAIRDLNDDLETTIGALQHPQMWLNNFTVIENERT